MRCIFFVALAPLIAGCQTNPPSVSEKPSAITYGGSFAAGAGTKEAALVVNGVARTVYTYAPSSLGTNRALLIVFDGTDNSAYDALTKSGGKTLANNQKLVVVAPEPRALPGGDWDMHSSGQHYWETYPNADPEHNNDLALVQAIILEAKRVYGIDSRKVYTLGFSNGAFFAEFAAFTMPDRLAAWAETSGGLVTCAKTRGPTGCNFYTTTGTTCAQFATQPGWCSCTGTEKPAAVPTSGRVPPGYLSHPRDDNTISVYYSCMLKSRMDALGATSSLVVRTGNGHAWPTNFATTAWPFLSQVVLPDHLDAGAPAADGRASDTRPADTRAPDTRAPDRRAPDTRLADTRAPDTRAPDARAPDTRRPYDLAAPDRATDRGASPDQFVARYSGTFSNTVGFAENTLTVAGYSRMIVSYVPSSMGSAKALLFMFSPTGENDPYYTIINSGAKALADSQKILVLAPRARNMSTGDWDNHGPGDIYYETYPNTDPTQNPDLLMVQASIQEAVRVYGINPKKVYTAGFSNGAFFSVFSAMTMPYKIAAFSEASGGLVQCSTTQSCTFHTDTGTSCSAFASQEGWCSCSDIEKPAPVPTAGRIPPGHMSHARDDTTVSPYYSCALKSRMDALGATSSLTIRTGGGHVWPSGYATSAWSFLSQYTLP